MPLEYVTSVREGGFYGWPWYYIGAHEEPRRKGERPDLKAHVIAPDVLLEPHTAPLGMTFHDGYAYVAMHGSWNRSERAGYKVVRLPMKRREGDRRLRGLPDRLRRGREERVGEAGRRRRPEGRVAAGQRRRQRLDLAGVVLEVSG